MWQRHLPNDAAASLFPNVATAATSAAHFSASKVTSALLVTCGAMVDVEYIEGCAVSMEQFSVAQSVTPNLFVNKVDRSTVELQVEPEGMCGAMPAVLWSTALRVAQFRWKLFSSAHRVIPVIGSSLAPLSRRFPALARIH